MGGGEVRLQLGSVFAGDYRVVRPLAEGGMGAVYLVDQISTGKPRALKVMRSELAADADSRRRFELEARVGAAIESEHVVEIHSAGVDAGTPYIVMELLDGEDLATRVERAGPLAPSEVRELFEQLCHAVAAAHVAGVVHRDLKPENVFLARSKRAGGGARFDVKVLDFGIAKHVAESATRGQTMGMIGTPMWMAPEQTEPGKSTPAADVWALGLILYFVTTGHPYWVAAGSPDATLTQLLKEVVMGPLPAASVRARAQGAAVIATELDGVFARCVVRDPKQRYANAQLLWDALSRVLAPPSVRIVTESADTASATLPGNSQLHGQTVAAVPPSASFQAVSLNHGAGMTRSGEPWKRLWPVPVALFAVLAIGQCAASSYRRSAAEREAAAREAEAKRLDGFTLTPVAAPTLGSQGRRSSAGCRLCTGGLRVGTGPLSREVLTPVLEGAYPMMDQQCLSGRMKRPATGSATFAFVVHEGRATNRRIESSTSTDKTDECLMRAFADLGFPSSTEDTEVSVTLSFNSAVR